MAKQVSKRNVRSVGSTKRKSSAMPSPFHIFFEKENYIFLYVGVALCIVGFYLLSVGPWDSSVSLVAAPLILLLSYLVIFPLSMFYKKRSASKSEEINNLTE